ncbi:MAG: general secretion pathway protein GspB [Nitrospiraceae bacterium]|nr:MAG: general secretion pathway protein GspB [Nitrospiraceae bacterium]
MSFILDALKKADRKRKRGEVPELLTVHDAEITHSQRKTWWLYIVIGVLLLNTGVFLWWLNPWQTAPEEIISSSVPDARDGRERTTLADASGEGPVAVKPRKAIKKHAAKTATDVSEGDLMRERPVFASLKTDEPAHSSHKPAPPVEVTKPGGNTIYNPEELPYSVQKELPELIITVHLYSDDPSSRMINTYGKTVKEGQAVTDDLKLEEITPDSVIFSYKGYKFRKKLF